MADAQLNIVLQLIDNATAGVTTATNKLSEGMEKAGVASKNLGREINSVGRELNHIGETMVFIGGAIQAVFIKALADSSKESLNVNQALKTLGSEFEEFERLIAEAVVPVINKIITYFDNFNKAIQSIPQSLRDQIIQSVFLTSILVALGGAITILIGKIFSFVGNLFKLVGTLLELNPVILGVAAAIITITFLIFKFSDTTKQVLNVLQGFFLSLKEGFFDIKASLENFVSSGLMNLSKLYDALANLPGPLQNFYRKASVEAQTAANVIRSFANNDLRAAKQAASDLQNIMMNKDGSWASGFQKIKDKAIELIDILKNIGKTSETVAIHAKLSFNQMMEASQGPLANLSSALQGAASANKAFATASQVVAIGLAIVNTALAITKARSAAPPPFNYILAGIEAAAGAIQIATIASQKFHSGGIIGSNLGSDEVPIIAQTGEGILSRRGMAALGGENALNALNSGASSSSEGGIQVNVYYPKMSTTDEVKKLSNQLGLEIQRQLRYAI